MPHHVVDVVVDVQESKASFCWWYFGYIFYIHDFFSFCIALIHFRDAESLGWWGTVDKKEEEKETNDHPGGLGADWLTRTWLVVIINHCILQSSSTWLTYNWYNRFRLWYIFLICSRHSAPILWWISPQTSSKKTAEKHPKRQRNCS